MPRVILVVDDSETIRKILSTTLRLRGFHPVTASDGMEALERIAEGGVDLIITDLNMPVMDGYELTAAVRRTAPCRDVPIIMLTTEAEEEDRRRGLEAGVNAYLTKPAQPSVLLAHIEQLLN